MLLIIQKVQIINSNYNLDFIFSNFVYNSQPLTYLNKNLLMIDYLGFNLTQYKSFRQLQLEHLKTKNQNQTLNYQLNEIAKVYHEKCKQLIQLKSNETQQKLKHKSVNFKYKKLYFELLDCIQTNFSSIIKADYEKESQSKQYSRLDDKSVYMHLQQQQRLQKICLKVEQFTKQHLNIQQKSAFLSKKLQKATIQLKSENLQKRNSQHMIINQINHLQIELQQLHQMNAELKSKLVNKEREKKQKESELRQAHSICDELEEKVGELVRQVQDKSQQDSQFALDFMTFQLQTIQSFYMRLAQSTKRSQHLSDLMSVLYEDYKQISQIFKQKLQIEYDLEQLEQRYKKEKGSKQAQQNLLIETRRQIQAFRLQLFKQKQIFKQKELYVDQRFQQYLEANQQELKVKKYTYELQNRLYRHKISQVQTCERMTTLNPTARDILGKRQNKQHKQSSEQQADQSCPQQQIDIPSKKASLRFKQTNNVEQLMRQIVKKDKDNLERLLKENRKTSVPMYKGR